MQQQAVAFAVMSIHTEQSNSCTCLSRLRVPSGDLFVDQRCIDCQTCRWMYGAGKSSVTLQDPRYTTKLVNNIEKLGARYMFLTHWDDVADDRKWAELLKCEMTTIHPGDVKDVIVGVEWKLTGNVPWNIGADFERTHTPGHTKDTVIESLIAKGACYNLSTFCVYK
ncbi:hypothetical protein GUJ93_ZPchr0006g42138 [Zizania palustris]|uniref:Metallo-beta-lactamase domain-containing protein n=1 Tax=Zizania palustris TaxID=103762 RepID=A0A8J5W2D6_ZIZPA|nr:hypothetical protein GUJ93_ZPchr0006g42138 [Zizania palustris]